VVSRATPVALLLWAVVPVALAESPGDDRTPDPWQTYVRKARWREGEAFYLKSLLVECRRKRPSPASVRDLYFGWAVCRYFPRIAERVFSEEARRRFVSRLLADRGFTRMFLLALRPEDDPGRVFQILHHLLQADSKTLERHGRLALAFAVVWDRYPPDRSLLREVFAYYVRNAERMRFDLRAMPYEVSKYVVDTRRPVAERVWALDRYGGTGNIGRLYRLIEYDTRAFTRGGEPEVRGHAPTLPNLRKYGGLCHEQALFASEVGKAVGVPSVYVSGPSQSGIGHAWVAFLRRRRDGYLWDRETGRTGRDERPPGFLIEPQTGRRRPESELDFALAALNEKSANRADARLWVAATEVLVAAQAPAEALRCLRRSIETSVSDRRQWELFARLARAGAVHEREVLEAISIFTRRLTPYPALAVEAFSRLVQTLDKTPQKRILREYDAVARRFRKDTAAFGRIRLLQGRFLESRKKDAAAARVYAEAALETAASGAATLPLLDHAARLMRRQGHLKEAVALHQAAFARAEKPRRTAYAVHSTWFKIGLRLAKLRALAGDRTGHDRLLRRICSYQRMSASQRQAFLERLAAQRYRDIVPPSDDPPSGK